MNRKNKIYSGILTLLFFIALTSFAFTPAGEWIGNTVSGFLNPATEDLDMANNDIKMGTGLIGFDGTANEGLSFDTSGNINVNSASIFRMNGCSLYLDADNDTYITGVADDVIRFYTGGGGPRFTIDSTGIYSGGGSKLMTAASSATVPNIISLYTDTSGIGQAAAGQLSLITTSRETMRLISFADADVADNEVVVTGVSGYHGLVLVRSLTDDTSAIYRVSNITVIDVSLDGDHTSTVTTAGHYNFYYDTDQFKLENKAGAGKSVSVAFWVLPT